MYTLRVQTATYLFFNNLTILDEVQRLNENLKKKINRKRLIQDFSFSVLYFECV